MVNALLALAVALWFISLAGSFHVGVARGRTSEQHRSARVTRRLNQIEEYR